MTVSSLHPVCQPHFIFPVKTFVLVLGDQFRGPVLGDQFSDLNLFASQITVPSEESISPEHLYGIISIHPSINFLTPLSAHSGSSVVYYDDD